MKKNYRTPVMLRKEKVELEVPFLVGSVVEKRLEVDTAGQQTVNHDFSDPSSFKVEWK